MKQIINELEKLIFKQRGISDLMGIVSFMGETQMSLNDFQDGLYFLYRLADDNVEQLENAWQKLIVTYNESYESAIIK